MKIASANSRETVIAESGVETPALLFRDGSWWADYRRIRITACKK